MRRFEQLALGYNSEELGELDDDDKALHGGHELDQYAAIMNDFLSEHATHDHAHEGGQHYDVPAEQAMPMSQDQQEAAIAVAMVCLLQSREFSHGCPAQHSLWLISQLACLLPRHPVQHPRAGCIASFWPAVKR